MEHFENIKAELINAFYLSWSPRKASFTDRPHDTLSFRIKGNAVYTHEKDNFQAKNNDIVFVPKKHNYFFTAKQSEELFAIHFNIENSKFDSIQVFTPKNPELFRDLFEKLYNTYNLKHTGYKYNALSIFYKILEELQIEKETTYKKPDKLQLALDYINENFQSNELSICNIAHYIGTSETYLRKLFHKNLGLSPVQFLTKIRLSKANKLLQTGYYTIEEITSLTGFSDAKYFSTVYKKHYGFPPSKYLYRE